MTTALGLVYIGDSLNEDSCRSDTRLEELALRHKIGYLDGCRLFSGEVASTPHFLEEGSIRVRSVLRSGVRPAKIIPARRAAFF